jgi:RND family efflux transporter MFP subunit
MARAVLCAAASMLLCTGCSQGSAAEEGETTTVNVSVAEVAKRPISKVLTYSGDIVGEVEVKVYSTIPDRIVTLNAEEGQAVAAGQVLAVIRADTLGQGVQQAQGGLAAVRAQVAGLRDNLSRQERLLSSGVVTQAQVDATRFQLQAAEAQVAQLEATVGSAQTRRSDANVRAPISGIIGQVFVEEGDLAAPQIPICTIVRMDRVEVQINVPERELALVRPGLEAIVSVASLDRREFSAPVSEISPVVDRLSRTARLKIMLDNPDHAIRPGSLAEVRLEVERHDDAIVVPQYALVLDERQDETSQYRAYVLRADGRTVEERRVRVGFYDGNDVEVLEGLRAGERLVVNGQHLLRDGTSVEVRAAPGEARDAAPEARAASADGGADRP